MPLSPICLVNSGPTTNGVNVTPSSSVSVTLLDPTSPGMQWFLEVVGTDELTSPPLLTNVNVLTHQVTSPGATVTFVFPASTGRAIGFKSRVTGTGGPIETTFGVYSLTGFATRVGFVTETREGDLAFGWATKLNSLIRSGGGGGGGPNNYSLSDVSDAQTIPVGQQMLYVDDVVIEDGGDLIVEGDVVSAYQEENFSVLYVPPTGERIVGPNEEMFYTSDMVVDGQLTVDGQIVDGTPYDGNDVLAALVTVAPNAVAILSQSIIDVSLVTTDATPTLVTNYLTTVNNSIVSFDFLVIARSTTNETAAFKLVGVAQRLVGATSVVIEDLTFLNGPYRSAGAASWDVTLVASGGGPGIQLLVTGAAATTIHWRASGSILERD
jgi:hypothetical protein